MENIWRFLKNLKIDPGIPPLSIYPKKIKTLTQEGVCTPMFMMALVTIAKIWKQPKCPSIDEWIKKMWYIYNEILKDGHPTICDNMDGLLAHYAK